MPLKLTWTRQEGGLGLILTNLEMIDCNEHVLNPSYSMVVNLGCQKFLGL